MHKYGQGVEPSEEHLASGFRRPGMVVWMSGLSGSGKTSIANSAGRELAARHIPAFVLDGDLLRQGLNSDLGFSEHDRLENQRRTAEVARLMALAGMVTIVALISPLAEGRRQARAIIGAGWFAEVFVNCPFEVARKRDVKGLYAKAEAGLIGNFTGIDSPFEPPQNPDLELRTDLASLPECTNRLVEFVLSRLAHA